MGETLTLAERETLISFDETPAKAVIFTYSKAWQRHLEKILGLKPVLTNGCGGREYHIEKSRIRPPRAPRNLSPEAKKRLADNLARARRTVGQSGARKHNAQAKSTGSRSVRGKQSSKVAPLPMF